MNEIIVKDEKKTEIAEAVDYKAIALQWLTSTGNLKKFTENEKNQFFDICAAFKLNPIKKEVYGVKYGDNFNIIVGYEVYLKRAQRSGLLDGFNTITEKTPDGDIKAICTIYRKDWTHPYIHEVFLSEYDSNKSLWATKKITMIKKVAEAQAFRKCFTDELGGMPYTPDELPEEMTTDEPTSTAETPIEKPVEKTVKKPAPKIAPQIEKKYTPEQAQGVANLIGMYPEIFTDAVKIELKKKLVKDGGEAALKAAEDLIKASQKGAPTPAEENAINAIF